MKSREADIYAADIQAIETRPGEPQRYRVSVTLNGGFVWSLEGARVAGLIRDVAADVLRDTLVDTRWALDDAWTSLGEEQEEVE